MNTHAPRPNLTSIAAACILSGGLIAAAIIDSHKPVTVISGGSHVPLVAATGSSTPPYAQEDVEKQVEVQLLTSPKLHNFDYKDSACTLTAAHATLVEYSSKDDQFYVTLAVKWQSKATEAYIHSDSELPVATHTWSGGDSFPPDTGYIALSNDGYGRYHGSFSPGSNEPNMPSVDVVVR